MLVWWAYSSYEKTALMAAIAEDSKPLPLNTDVTQENINDTICKRGYTRTVRPSVVYTNAVKRQKLLAQGLPVSAAKDYELDHIIPLELGGAPADPRNLQLQIWHEAHEKDFVENCLNYAVCHGGLALDEAQGRIWVDWHEAKHHCESASFLGQQPKSE